MSINWIQRINKDHEAMKKLQELERHEQEEIAQDEQQIKESESK